MPPEGSGDESAEGSDDCPEDETGLRAGLTRSLEKRHWLTNDILAYTLLGSFPIVVVLGMTRHFDHGAIPCGLSATYGAVVVGAAAWAFGGNLLERFTS